MPLDLVSAGPSTPTTPVDTTVLIVGGGPSGLAAATELAQRGIDCVLIEPREQVHHDRPRAKTTSVRTMEHFRRWGLAENLREVAPLPVAWSQRVVFCTSLSGAAITEFDHAFGLHDVPQPGFAESGQQVPQPVVEQLLRDQLKNRPEVVAHYGSAVTSLTQLEDRVSAVVAAANGKTSIITARWVLGCDGPNGVARTTIAAKYVGRSEARTNFNVVFTAPTLETPLGSAVQYWSVGEVPGLIGRLDLDGTWWSIFPGVDNKTGHADLDRLLTGIVGRPFDYEVLATDEWTARMLIADKFHEGRIFLVGESAHLNPPWGGHGYNTCVGDAVNIAWKITAVERGWAPRSILETYDAERRPVIEQTVAVADNNMQTLAIDLDTDADRIQLTKYKEFHSLGLVLDYSYASSPIVQPGISGDGRSPGPRLIEASKHQPTAAPGTRLPHHWLSDGTSLFDHLGSELTVVGPEVDEITMHEVLATAAGLGVQVTFVAAPTDYPWRDRFLLVRPDQHIAWAGSAPGDLDLAAAIGRSSRNALPTTLANH